MNKSYAQAGQDLLAAYYFKHYPASQRIFLDIGAFDGIGFSNTRLLFERGWRGVCVEPVLKNYKKLESLYQNTNVITIRAAAADYEGEITLNVATIPWAEEWGSDVSSPTDDVLERWPEYIWEKETVPVITVSKILELNDMTHADFVSIDVEGHEMAVLRGFDLQKFRPHLIVVEYSNSPERRELRRYMNRQGYFPWADNGQDIFFVRGSASSHWRILPRGLWVNFSFSKPGQFIRNIINRFVK
jgi:FkbM family methyltransferase